MRILLVEDDSMIGEVVQDALRAEHYAVDWIRDGASAQSALATTPYDLLLLDLGLPRTDGLTVLRALRAKKKILPVLIATARDAVADRVRGLDAGADDYIVKPYDLDELLARVRALLRRGQGGAETTYQWRDVRIDPATHTASRAGAGVPLSAREWAVLQALLARPGRVLSREQLEDKLYAWGEEVSSNAVEVYIHGIRRKLGAALIENVRGLGYSVPNSNPVETLPKAVRT
jgi:two-component system OmpR family response regulator